MIRIERGEHNAYTAARCDSCGKDGPRDVSSVLQFEWVLRLRAAARALEQGWLCDGVTCVAWCPQCSGVRPGPLSGARVEGQWLGLVSPEGERLS